MTKVFARVSQALALWCAAISMALAADGQSVQCGDEGVWIQILGAGAGELDSTDAGPSYLVWSDDRAVLMVNTGSASAVQFARSGARLADLDAIAYNDVSPERTAALPFFIAASINGDRDRPLTVLGPTGNDTWPDTKTFIERLIGPEGAHGSLADFLTYKSRGGYKISVRDVPSTGQRRWARYGSQNFRLSAIPVSNASTPAVAWRVDINDMSLVFTGAFGNQKDAVAKFAQGADALIVPHAIPESTRGALLEQFAKPSKIGEIAAAAQVRTLILGHRANRTRGRESQSSDAIRTHYAGPLIFANDLECWGL